MALVDFPAELCAWFLEMGYPFDDSDSVEWNTLCCGRLKMFWKDIMKVIKPKNEVSNVKRNLLLREMREFEKRRHTSAFKIGSIQPPRQVYYFTEQEKLQNELEMLNREIEAEKLDYKKDLSIRKHKCYELQKTKEDILDMNRKIHAMKQLQNDLNNEIEQCKSTTDSILTVNTYFITKDRPISTENQQNDEQKLCNVLESILSKSEDESFINNAPTAQLLNMVLEYQNQFPKSLDADLKALVEQNKINLIKASNDDECLLLKDNLYRLNLFHCRLVIAAMNHKKEQRKIKNATEVIKKKIMSSMPANSVEKDIFEHELAQIASAAYSKTLEAEFSDLKDGRGFYSHLGSRKIKQNVQNLSNDVNDRYATLCNQIVVKKDEISSQLERLTENADVKNYLTSVKQNNRADKVLWQPEYKELQDVYFKMILKNPDSFKTESANPFESFTYLKAIFAEYNIRERLIDLESNSLDKLKTLVGNSDSNDESNEFKPILNWSHAELLRPLRFAVQTFINKIKFKKQLEETRNQFTDDFNYDWPKTLLGDYLTDDLHMKEKELLSDTFKLLPKSNAVESLLDEFKEFYDFYVEFVSNKENLNKTPN